MVDKRNKVLIVDDSPTDSNMIRDMIISEEGSPFDVILADRLSKGLKLLDEEGIDLVLLDLFLPESRGLSTLSKVNDKAPQTPIVVLTGAHDEEMAIKTLQSGAQDYLLKEELNRNLLRRTMRYSIERKRVEEMMAQQSRELARSNTELASVNNELESFAYSVSHDLRAPLRSIDGFSQALLEEYADKLDAQGKEYLQRVHAAALHMAELINDLLSLSRVTRTEITHASVDLSALAHEVAVELQKQQPERQMEFNITEGLTGDGDKNLLRIALTNLLGNAYKFTSKCKQARIEFGVTQHKGKPSYFVRDNGVGFDMAYANKLFSPFQRLHSPGEFPGTGIGLAIVQRVIHRHGGDVWAEGKVDQGATIYFTLKTL